MRFYSSKNGIKVLLPFVCSLDVDLDDVGNDDNDEQ